MMRKRRTNHAPARLESLSALELERLVPLKEAARLRGVSISSLRLHCADRIIKLSIRRSAMRVKDALEIT